MWTWSSALGRARTRSRINRFKRVSRAALLAPYDPQLLSEVHKCGDDSRFDVISLTVLLALVATACTQGPTDTTPADSGTAAETTGEVQTTVITETSTADTTAPPETTPATETTATAAAELTFGMIMVGPENDHGWSQALSRQGSTSRSSLAPR